MNNVDLNTITQAGNYFVTGTNPNSPYLDSNSSYNFLLEVTTDNNRVIQKAYLMYSNDLTRHRIDYRYRVNNTWSEWTIISGSIATLYVRTSGNDANSGSPDSPLRTIEAAFRKGSGLNGGALTIYVGEGDWGIVNITSSLVSTNKIIYLIGASNEGINNTRFEEININDGHYCVLGRLVSDRISVNRSGFNLTSTVGFATFQISAMYNSIINLNRPVKFIPKPNFKDWTAEDKIPCFEVSSGSYTQISGSESVLTFSENNDDIHGYFVRLNSNDCRFRLSSTATITNNLTCQRFYSNNYGTIYGKSPWSLPGATTPPRNADGYNILYEGKQTQILPCSDGVFDIGASNARFNQVFASTGSIQTSDEREKTNINSIPEEVFQAWSEVDFQQFNFKTATKEKGDNARLHTGLIAQRIDEVFKSHGLDATKYGLFCYDEWEEKNWEEDVVNEEYFDEEGNLHPREVIKEQHHEDGGNRYALRYDECLCMEAAYQRYRADRIEARLTALEKKVK